MFGSFRRHAFGDQIVPAPIPSEFVHFPVSAIILGVYEPRDLADEGYEFEVGFNIVGNSVFRAVDLWYSNFGSITMSSFSFIHAADLHLDTPFIGVSCIDPQAGKRMQDASLEAWDNLVNGAILVRVENDHVAKIDFLPFDVVRCSDINLDASNIRDLPALERTLDHEMNCLRQKHSSKGLLLRAQLNGRSALNRDLRRPNVREELLSSMREHTIGMNPFVWWSDIRDNTHSPVDLAKIRGSGDFRDILLQLSESIRKDERIKQEFLDEILATPGIVKPYLEEINRTEFNNMDAIWKEAVELALDLLSADE